MALERLEDALELLVLRGQVVHLGGQRVLLFPDAFQVLRHGRDALRAFVQHAIPRVQLGCHFQEHLLVRLELRVPLVHELLELAVRHRIRGGLRLRLKLRLRV